MPNLFGPVTDSLYQLTSPARLRAEHSIVSFDSGEPSLDEWLKKRALENSQWGASKTYVVCPYQSSVVIGYYSLSMGQILNQDVPGSMRRNMPSYIPAVILGRFAIDQKWQGKGLGQGLLKDAILRCLKAAHIISARLLIVHAISKDAEEFYIHHGFTALASEKRTLALDLIKIKTLFAL
jgi:GNAT superfamily N-acetyltransferase